MINEYASKAEIGEQVYWWDTPVTVTGLDDELITVWHCNKPSELARFWSYRVRDNEGNEFWTTIVHSTAYPFPV